MGAVAAEQQIHTRQHANWSIEWLCMTAPTSMWQKVGMHPSVEKKERTIKYSKKAFGNKSSRNPTSLENLFNTRPNQNTNLKELACTMQHRLTTRICVKEKYWNSENGLKHSVMQNPGSSVADQIESNSLY